MDLKATGNMAPGVPSPPATATPGGFAPRMHTNRQASPQGFDPTSGKSKTEIAGELVSGAGSGVGQAVASAFSIDVLNVPTGLLRVVGTAWEEGDPVGGLSALFWEPGAAQVDALVASAVDGDFKGAAEAGAKAISIGVATGVALGELGGAAAEAAKGAKDAAAPTPRVSSKTLRGKWEAETGRPWPKDPVSGRNQAVAHTKPLAEGGTNGVDNIEPLPHDEHVRRHTEAGDFRRWGAKGAAAKKAGAE